MANYWKLFVGDLHSCNDHWPPCNSNLLVEALVSKVVYCIGIRLYPRQQHFGVVFPWTRFPLIVKTFNCWQSASRYTRCYHDMGICWPQPLVAIIQGQFNKMVQHFYFVHTDQPLSGRWWLIMLTFLPVTAMHMVSKQMLLPERLPVYIWKNGSQTGTSAAIMSGIFCKILQFQLTHVFWPHWPLIMSTFLFVQRKGTSGKGCQDTAGFTRVSHCGEWGSEGNANKHIRLSNW